MDETDLQAGTVLLAVAQDTTRVALESILREAGYAVPVPATDAQTALSLYLQHRPDLVLLDPALPDWDGYSVIDQISEVNAVGSTLPILALIPAENREAKQRALQGGATDFLTLPLDPVEVAFRVRRLLETRAREVQLQAQTARLEQEVHARAEQVEAAQLDILARLTQAAEYRDDETGRHPARLGQLAALLASALGLPIWQVDLLRQTAPLHDVGKIGVASAILYKPGPLTPAEWSEIKQHTIIGARLLAGASSRVLRTAQAIALTHHERWDGTGYPGGLAGPRIPLAGRIVAVADVLDVLTHKQPYKSAWPLADALAEIRAQSGRQFDPAVVAALERIHQQPAFAAVLGEDAAPDDEMAQYLPLEAVGYSSWMS